MFNHKKEKVFGDTECVRKDCKFKDGTQVTGVYVLCSAPLFYLL